MPLRGLLLLLSLAWACASTSPAPEHPQPPLADEPAEPTMVAQAPSKNSDEVSAPPEAETAAAEFDDDQGEDGDEGFDELGEEGQIDDGGDEGEEGPALQWQDLGPHPLDGLSAKQLATMVRTDLSSLGSISLGRIHGGALLNGIQLPEGERWIVRQPQAAWGTKETVDSVAHCIETVASQFEETPKLYVGHLSRARGGRFPPHVSHQNGRDVDLGYYYTNDDSWYTKASEVNLDTARTWALVRCFVTDTDVELILTIRPIARLLREHAESIGEDSHWLDQLFGGNTATLRPLIRHASGHGTHLHVRFYSPTAQESGRRLYAHLVKAKLIQTPTAFISHRAKKGHTLAYLAKRYGVSQQAIKRANKLRGSMLREGKSYLIPRAGGVTQLEVVTPVKLPRRRLPPTSPAAGHGGGVPVNIAP